MKFAKNKFNRFSSSFNEVVTPARSVEKGVPEPKAPPKLVEGEFILEECRLYRTVRESGSYSYSSTRLEARSASRLCELRKRSSNGSSWTTSVMLQRDVLFAFSSSVL